MNKKILEVRSRVCRSVFAVAVLLFTGSRWQMTQAKVVRIVVEPGAGGTVEGGREFGAAGTYERLVGEAYGELDPNDRNNRIIQDIDLAPRNAKGKVEYVAFFTLLKPKDMSRASGLLFYDVVNRGNELSPFAVEGQGGDHFLMERGAVVLRSGWQGDIPWDAKNNRGERAYPVRVPIAINPDGSSITGKVLIQFVYGTGNTAPLVVSSRPIAYLPSSLDTRRATLSVRVRGPRGPLHSISSADWAWADCTKIPFPGAPDPTRICLKNGFDPSGSYELVFVAKDPLVLGIGFAATRDIVSFFHFAQKDEAGTPNPLADKIRTSIGMGSSQTGQFVRTFINLGFNQDEAGRRVWDGAIPNIAGRQLSLNLRFALPDGGPTPNVPDGQGVLWWGDWTDKLRGHKSSSLLARCRATNTCPKIFETFGSGELWGIRMSPSLIGTDASADLQLPQNVRRYFSPSTKHGGGAGGFSTATLPAPVSIRAGQCSYPDNPNSQAFLLRSLLPDLVSWIETKQEPPPSRYPRLVDRTLRQDTKAALAFPDIPGMKFVDNIGVPQYDYDFGPGFKYDDVSGVLTKVPPSVKHQLAVYVPAVDADGNETAGIPSVLLRAPLGTYTGWNLGADGFYKDEYCPYAGSFFPFARTKAERLARNDPRRSLEERYRNHAGYTEAVRHAADKSVSEGFLLPEDRDLLIREAAASDVLE
jgi:hypothetical protein